MINRILLALVTVVFYSLPVFSKTSAIIENATTDYILSGPNDLTIVKFVRITVLDEDGYKYAVYQDYYNKFRKIKSLRYTIFDPTGKRMRKYSKADALDIAINASYEIGDARLVVLDPEYRSFPFTIEMEVEIVYNGFLDFPLWMPRYGSSVQVKKASLTLKCDKNFQYRSREVNGVQEPVITEKDNVKTAVWSVENLPAIEDHISYKSFAADQPKVHLAPFVFSLEGKEGNFKSWRDFGDWYYELNEGRNKITDATKEYLDGLRKQYGDNTVELSKAVYKHMQSKTRYISIQLGIGGYQTIPSDKVEENGYGDCKALTNYMKAMLDYVNIPSNNVLVYAGSDAPDILHDFPSNQFNHVFLAVPTRSDTLWFECTNQTAPPAFIGTFTDDRYVLWVTKGGSEIIRTPAYSAFESFKTTDCNIIVGPKGDAQFEFRTTQSGMFYDEVMYYQNLTPDRIEKFNYSRFPYKDFSIQSFNHAVPDKNNSILTLDYKLNVNGLGKSLGTKMILPANLLTPMEDVFRLDPINKKTEVRRSFTIEDKVQVTLPENYRVDLNQESKKETWPFGTFEMKFETDESGRLNIYRRAVIKKGNYVNEKFDAFYEMIKKIRAIEQAKIVLVSKT